MVMLFLLFNNQYKSYGTKKLLSEFQTPNFNDWIKEAELSNNGKPIDKLITKTVEGIDFFPIYTQKNMEEIAHLQNNLPGFFPYIRSSNHSGYKAKAWNIAQENSYCKPADFNTLLSYLISHGLNSLLSLKHFKTDFYF
jgi:methylmalonyl-CoA mutase